MKIKTTFTIFYVFLALIYSGCQALASEMKILDQQTIQDQGGRTIQVDEPFERIISLYGAHTENLFSLGLNQEVIGVGMNECYPPQALERPSFSYQEGPEKILAHRPDLVLVRPMIDWAYPRLMDTLERSGITIVSLQPGSKDEMFKYWKILGILTGKEEQALQMQENFKAGLEYARSLTAHVEDKKGVFFESIHEQLKTFSPDSMPMLVLEAAGGENAALDARQVRGTNIADFGQEKLLSRADKVQVYLSQQGPMNQASPENIKKRPGLHLLKAVQQNRVYAIDEVLVSRPTMRLLQGIYVVGEHLYPDIFHEDTREKLDNYRKMQGSESEDS
ncbi:ABC transporter substrate-binding protein [Desulfonatronospira sp. MSAO_Bac3]|uniref:ABC transporter substrate-binding protein n=1 Tax=Desulfonatronospira sp. MSAO_Bac3 TaxID=2293857 RepID=UPI000FF46D64|nr:ABC transporter substrate-binding protein [Desulfonatronospira sp. MSAO_Bac3]RQD74732.1 MAG: ABC transporter substrate-binding protein [Desulfonatronospira sp. MSAO_Bac3]